MSQCYLQWWLRNWIANQEMQFLLFFILFIIFQLQTMRILELRQLQFCTYSQELPINGQTLIFCFFVAYTSQTSSAKLTRSYLQQMNFAVDLLSSFDLYYILTIININIFVISPSSHLTIILQSLTYLTSLMANSFFILQETIFYNNQVFIYCYFIFINIIIKKIIMPTVNQSKIGSLMQKYNKQISNAQKQDQYELVTEIYDKILTLDPFSSKNYSKYSLVLRKLKQYQKASFMLEQALQIQPSNFNLYKQYLDLLFEMENFHEIKKVIKRAKKLRDDDISLCVKFARACHRSQTFAEGLEMIDKYELNYPQNVRKNQRILLWRVYLYYQVGCYKKAYQYSKIILESSEFECQDKEYYQIQICKYCLLLEQYEQSLSWAEKLLKSQNPKTDNKTMLKTCALKSFCLSKLGLNSQAAQAMQNALKLNKNDEITQCKYSLFKIIFLPEQDINNLAKWKVKQRLSYVLQKMKQCSEQKFDSDKFSQHFNWYQQMQEFMNNLKFLYQNFELLPTNYVVFKQIATNLIMSLFEGYECCLKIYDNLKKSRQTLMEKQRLQRNCEQSNIQK